MYQTNSQLTKIEAISFNKGDFLNFLQRKIPLDIVYKIKENEFRGQTTIQLMIEEMRVSE